MKDTYKLICSSIDKSLSSETSSDFSFILPSSYKNFNSFRLTSCSIPFTWYVVQNFNRLITFEEQTGGGEITFNMTNGNYTPSTLLTHLIALLNANSPNLQTYSGSYDSTNNKYTITSTGNFRFIFNSSVSYAFNLLGFNSGITTYSLSKTSPNQVNLSIQTIYIRSNLLGSKLAQTNIHNLQQSNIIACILVNVFNGQIIQYYNTFDEYIGVVGKNFNKLDIKITDYNNNIIDLNGLETFFEFTFCNNKDY